jgi:hypothetical protein
MPNLIGYDYEDAFLILQQVNIFNPQALGYFGAFPISIIWTFGPKPSFVLGQSIAAGLPVATNAPVTLTVAEFPMGVAFP